MCFSFNNYSAYNSLGAPNSSAILSIPTLFADNTLHGEREREREMDQSLILGFIERERWNNPSFWALLYCLGASSFLQF